MVSTAPTFLVLPTTPLKGNKDGWPLVSDKKLEQSNPSWQWRPWGYQMTSVMGCHEASQVGGQGKRKPPRLVPDRWPWMPASGKGASHLLGFCRMRPLISLNSSRF